MNPDVTNLFPCILTERKVLVPVSTSTEDDDTDLVSSVVDGENGFIYYFHENEFRKYDNASGQTTVIINDVKIVFFLQ